MHLHGYYFSLLLVFVRPARQDDDNDEEKKGEDALSWAAALVLTIPPSILAILLAHHIAKRQMQPLIGGVSGSLGSSRAFSGRSSELDVHSDSVSSIEEEILRAEGEGVSYSDYDSSLPKIVRRPGRLLTGLPSTHIPSHMWLRSGSPRRTPYTYGRISKQHMSYGYSDILDDPYVYDPLYRRRIAAARSYERARPLFHELSEVEELADAQWTAAAAAGAAVEPHAEEMQMHGGL